MGGHGFHHVSVSACRRSERETHRLVIPRRRGDCGLCLRGQGRDPMWIAKRSQLEVHEFVTLDCLCRGA
eukprot:6992720-Pyramimonas_sp.AAC.1